MEACPGSQWLARKLSALGHRVFILPAQFVKPFVKSNKNDIIDAEAIVEALNRPTMRFVQIKTEVQSDLQAIHRVRDNVVAARTKVVCQARAFCLEYGIGMRPHSDAVLQTEGSCLTDHFGTSSDYIVPNPMDGLQITLNLRFNLYKPHGGAIQSFNNCFGIDNVVFVRFNKGFDKLRRKNKHPVAKRTELSG